MLLGDLKTDSSNWEDWAEHSSVLMRVKQELPWAALEAQSSGWPMEVIQISLFVPWRDILVETSWAIQEPRWAPPGGACIPSSHSFNIYWVLSIGAESPDSRNQPKLDFQPHHFLAVWPRSTHLMSGNLSFCIYQIGIIISNWASWRRKVLVKVLLSHRIWAAGSEQMTGVILIITEQDWPLPSHWGTWSHLHQHPCGCFWTSAPGWDQGLSPLPTFAMTAWLPQDPLGWPQSQSCHCLLLHPPLSSF